MQYLSTIGLDGKPKVRPFQFMLEKGGKLYFCTNNKKDVFEELEKFPYVQISVSNAKWKWIRLSAKTVFTKDLEIKKDILAANDFVRSAYKAADNPIFEVFYLEDVEAVIADFSGNPPKKYNF